MTPAQQYHERERNYWMDIARQTRAGNKGMVEGNKVFMGAIRRARAANHKAIHVARLTRARQAQP